MRVVHSPRHRLHDPQVELESSGLQSPFEHGGRVDAILAALVGEPGTTLEEPPDAGEAPILAVHDPGLVRFLASAWAEYQEAVGHRREVVPDVFAMPGLRRGMAPATEPGPVQARIGWWCFETTTPIVEGTYAAARSAVDVALGATEIVLGGERVAYGLCRPPGHHATSSLYGGYCFFNNAAIAAHHVARTTGTRVSVLDVDYHHGNGTQEIFYERADVQYVSLHGDPARAYPYHTGFADEQGAGPGRGANVNLPLPAGTVDDDYLSALTRAAEAIARFGPSMLVVSLGLDTFERDPISDLGLTFDGLARCGAAVADLGLPTVVVQEGGYALDALGECARRWLTGFEGATPPSGRP